MYSSHNGYTVEQSARHRLFPVRPGAVGVRRRLRGDARRRIGARAVSVCGQATIEPDAGFSRLGIPLGRQLRFDNPSGKQE